MTSVPLSVLKTKRSSAKGSLTRIKTFIETKKAPLVEELECRLSLLEAYFKQLISIQLISMQLRNIVDSVNVHLKALRSLGSDAEILNAMLLHLATKKLDSVTSLKWDESIDYKKIPTWEDFSLFLNTRCQCLVSRDSKAKTEFVESPQINRRPINRSALTISKQQCMKCNSSEHSIHNCTDFLNMTALSRFNEVKRLGLCVNCLYKGHSVKNCRSASCRVCSSPHHSLLHRYSSPSPSSNTATAFNDSGEYQANMPQIATTLHSSSIPTKSDQIILATAVVLVKDKSGQSYPIRVLLDSASQLNFITDSLSRRLQLKRSRADVDINGIGDLTSKVKFSTYLDIKSRFNDFSTKINALILDTITGVQPESQINLQSWQIPKNIQLADPKFNVPHRIDALLGAELFYQLLSVGQINLGKEFPILQKTVFGWIVSGRLQSSGQYREVCNLVLEQPNTNTEEISRNALQDLMEKFWKIEEIELPKARWTREHHDCEQHFVETTTRARDGRFVVRLPFKLAPSELGESYQSAYTSLIRLERKLAKDVETKNQYSAFMKEYENLGHMKLINDQSKVKYFIPHRCVLRPDSSSTKLRVVFNASCPTSSCLSLNDTLMVGPTIQNDLYSTIVRFRCRRYAVTADISKMYRQIWIAPEDRNYLAILWRDENTQQIKTFLLSTVTYGTASAPFQAIRCLTTLADEYVQDFPIGAAAIKKDFYVDDMISGADTIEDLAQLKSEVENVLSFGGFEIRKWSSNSAEFLETIPICDREPTLKINESDIVKTLGLIWNPQCDEFQFTWNAQQLSNKINKRSILSQISLLFDPLGLVSPIIIEAKLIMQELWSLKLSWDESLPAYLHNQWSTFRSQLQEVTEIRTPRYLYPPHFEISELHGFADASSKAYGCCLYVRCTNSEGRVLVNLVSSKSRVAPLKTQSLPRLELCAALLLSKLLHQIKELLKPAQRVVLWSDSEIVLHWIHGEPTRWNIFVANRVSQIQQLTQQSWWRHVNSASNPADIVSRGCTIASLKSSCWFSGPEFLQHSEEHWPKNVLIDSSLEVQEKRKSVAQVLLSAKQETDLIASHAFVNNYAKLCRIFAYALRYLKTLISRLQQKGTIINTKLYDTIEDLAQLKSEVENVLSFGGFEIRKWSSNSAEFLETIPICDREPTLKINESDIVKTLGLIWNPQCDEFQFTWNAQQLSNKINKRSILSQISLLFDPLGLVSPIIIEAKLIMQELWSLKLSWDESLPAYLHNQWSTFRSQLQEVTEIRTPRYLYPPHFEISELHGFADASSKAYGCCLYVRCTNSEGRVLVNLVSSKSRVAPLKTQSLPRLELCAALLLSKLLHQIKELLKPAQRVVLWSDSEIVLHWIHGEPTRWNIFVANRVSQIQQLTQQSWWRHVNSASNPADIVSRGCTIASLKSSCWFSGPEFLQHSEEHWPKNVLIDSSLEVQEKRKSVAQVLLSAKQETDLIASHAFVNNYAKLCRIFAYALRYLKTLISRLQQKGTIINTKLSLITPTPVNITPAEFEESAKRIIFIIQEKSFTSEKRALQKGKDIHSRSPLKTLCPFLDQDTPQLLRVGGRISQSNLPYNAKYPILLPKNHPFSLSYLIYLHKKLLHAGSQALVASSRQQFWIINAKGAANHVVRKCVHCFHYRPKMLQQIMGNLPSHRIQYAPPFANTGVDFCGPIFITSRLRGKPLRKAYIAVFICFISKAVHLEVVSDLSSDAFILALKRFVARRGLCTNIFCDNATNFVGARSKLAELYKQLFNDDARKRLLQICAEDKITFHFIPPRSPHFGGLWESAVKSAKFHLYRVIHKSSLTFEELSTVAAQVESILNSRPISAMSSDPNDEQVLTPGHFLIGRPLNALPEPDLDQVKPSLLNHWQHVCALQQHFWKRWVREYIPQLQQRYKWNSTSPDVAQGTLVVVADDQQPPQKWLLGRIVNTFPGEDGHIRVVDVKTKQGILRRAINKLAPLPKFED